MSNKCLVTGGAGFIGSHLVDELISRGHEVTVIDNLSLGRRENLNAAAQFHPVDIRDLAALKPLFLGVDWVFHTAALPRVQFSIDHPRQANEANVTGTLNVLLAAKEAAVKKVIYSASSSAYGNQSQMPLREDLTAQPISPYGLQKYIGELYCQVFSQVYGLPTVSLRYFNVYGPGMSAEGAYATVIAIFLRQRQAGQPLTITGDGQQRRDFTAVFDVVQANLLAAQSQPVGQGEVINIGRGRNHSVNEVAAMIGGPTTYIPARLEPRETLADISLAKKLLGWEPKWDLSDWLADFKS